MWPGLLVQKYQQVVGVRVATGASLVAGACCLWTASEDAGLALLPLQTPGTNSTWNTRGVPSKGRARAEGKGLIHSTNYSIVPRGGLTLQTEQTLCCLAGMSPAGDEQLRPPLLAKSHPTEL